MALLWTDGMDRYGAAADFSSSGGYYATAPSSFQPAGGKTGGGCARCTNAVSFRKAFSTPGVITAGNGVHFCGWLKVAALSANQGVVAFGTEINDTTSRVFSPQIIVNTNGSLSVTQHNAFSIVLATSTAGLFSAGVYTHLEYAAKLNTAANGGYIKVWINGNIVINFAGTTISGGVPASFTDFSLGKDGNDATNHDWDDIVFWDENGTDFAYPQITTAYLPVIETLSPDANDTVQFTPSTGSNFQNVDDPAFQNGDTDYNSSSTVGQADQFTLANQATTPAYTFGVTLKTVAKIDIAGTVNLRTRLVSGATTVESANRPLTTSYALYTDYYGKDPNTAAVWTPTQANNLKCGYKYQS